MDASASFTPFHFNFPPIHNSLIFRLIIRLLLLQSFTSLLLPSHAPCPPPFASFPLLSILPMLFLVVVILGCHYPRQSIRQGYRSHGFRASAAWMLWISGKTDSEKRVRVRKITPTGHCDESI